MTNFMKTNILIVFIDCKPEDSFNIIKKRGKKYENGITLAYLTKLYNSYEKLLKEIGKMIPIIRIQYSDFKNIDQMVKIVRQEFDNKIKIKKK